MSWITKVIASVVTATCPDAVAVPANYLGIVHTDPVTKATWVAGPGTYRGRFRRVLSVEPIGNSAETGITWDTEDFDDSGMIAVPAAGLGIPVAGLWAISLRGAMASVINARCFCSISFVSTVVGIGTDVNRSGFYGEDNFSVTTMIPFNAGDTFQCTLYQTSGGTVNMQHATLDVVWLGPNQ